MSATRIFKIVHGQKAQMLLLLSGFLLILNQRGVQSKRPMTLSISSELDLLADNQAAQTRELNRTNTHAAKPAISHQGLATDRATSRRHQPIAHPPDPLAASASSEARAVAGSRNVTNSRPLPLVSNQLNATSLSSVRQKWRQMEQTLSSSLARTSLELRRTLDQLLAGEQDGRPLPVSAQCRASLDEFLLALTDQELWAGQMVDASASRLPSGLLEGTLTELGHFDECLAVNNQRSTVGQYCSLQIKPALVNRPRLHTICRRLPSLFSGGASNSSSGSSQVMRFLAQNSHQFLYVGLRLGICVPSKCKQADVQALLSAYLQPFELIGQVKQCEQQEERGSREWRSDPGATNALALYLQQAYQSSSILHKFDLVQQCILLAFCTLFLLIALGTWLDASHKRPSSRANNCAVPSDLSSSSGAAAMPRRWQEYQVCRSSSGAGSSAGFSEHCARAGQLPSNLIYLNQVSTAEGQKQQRQQNGPAAPSLGLQRNPIAEFVVISTPSSTPDTRRSSRSSSCMLDNHELERLAPNKQKSRACMSANNNTNNNISQREERLSAGKQISAHFKCIHSARRFADSLIRLGLASSIRSRRRGRFTPASPDCVRQNSTDTDTNQAAEDVADNYAINSTTTASGLHHDPSPHERVGAKSHSSSEPSGERAWWAQFLVCFSLANNLRAIGKLSANSADDARNHADIKVIHGLRTLSMIWIIFGHTIGLVGPEMMNNLFPLAQLSCSSRLLQALLNATLAVDTFFMISGLVTVISFVRKCSSAALLMSGSGGARSAGELSGSRGQDREHDDLLILRRQSADGDGDEHHLHQLHKQQLDGADGSPAPSVIDLEEISSAESVTSSAVTSFSSSASSKRCISSTTFATSLAEDKKSGKDKRARPTLDKTASASETAGASFWPNDFKPLMWLLMRYLRLTPAYAAIIGLSILLPALGSGPFWAETVGQMGPACRANWWTNLLYVNNFLETDKLCLIHSWYLSNDWQFFLLTLLLFALFYKSQKLALLLLVSLILASSAATLLATIENDFPPTIVTTSPAVAERWQFIHQLYYKPWPHLPAYLVGLLVGYLILRQQISEPKQQLSRAGRLFCWLLFALIGLAVLNSIYPWNMGIQVDPLLTGLHSSTFRTLWAASCGWLVYALVTRPRNPLALLLGWPGFQVTSRLTYSAYLVHPLVIYYHFGSVRERIDSSPYGQLHRFMATLALSYLFALLLSLLVESPSIQLQHFLTRLSGLGSNGHRKSISELKAKPKKNVSKQQVMSNNHLKQYWAETNSTNNKLGLESEQISPMPLHADQLKANFHLPVVMLHHQPCEHLMSTKSCNNNNNNINANNNVPEQTSCKFEQEKDRTSSQSSSHSGSAIDVEFQKKLAQAIGRGFKIRTKIVNGANDGQQSPIRYQAARRLAPNKRPALQQAVCLTTAISQDPISDRLDSGADGLHQHQHRETRVPPPQPPSKPVLVSRRSNDQLSTFMACPAQPYIRATSRKTVESGVEHLPECCISATSNQQSSLPSVRNDLNLTEMIQFKQKLATRPQDPGKSVA